MSPSYLALLESLRVAYKLPAFPETLPSTQFHLKLENGLTLTMDFHPETDLVEFFCELGTYEEKDELEVLRLLIQANFLWAATAGGTLSARLSTRTVYLAYQTPLAFFEKNNFVDLVGKFGNTSTQWQLILQQLGKKK